VPIWEPNEPIGRESNFDLSQRFEIHIDGGEAIDAALSA